MGASPHSAVHYYYILSNAALFTYSTPPLSVVRRYCVPYTFLLLSAAEMLIFGSHCAALF